MRCQWNLDAAKESLITSVVFAGTMLGAYSWGWVADAKGRRCGFFGTAMFTFLFGIFSALAPNYQVRLFPYHVPFPDYQMHLLFLIQLLSLRSTCHP